jgi:hypothetical protein
MNSGEITLEECVLQLKEMFPQLDEEIIMSALFENENNFETTLNALINFQSANAFEEKKFEKNEKEISLFGNNIASFGAVESMQATDDFYLDKKAIEEKRRSNSISMNVARPNQLNSAKSFPTDNRTSEEQNKSSYGSKNTNTSSSDKNGNNFNSFTTDTKSKKSFGQKFKSINYNLILFLLGWINDVFTKKEKAPKKSNDYSSVGQNDD